MKKLWFLVATMLLCASLGLPARAQYPDRAIKMIVPFPAGGTTDNIFRTLAPLLQKHLGQPVVIANVTGGSGTDGAREARGSAADGYTIFAMPDYIHFVYYSGLEFLADARKRPGEITVGAAMSTNSHIFPATIEKKAGIKFKYVPYEGSAPRWTAILDGQVDLTDSNLTEKSKVDAGQLKFLVIASEQRDPEIPNVPTLKELGFDIVKRVERGLVVPKGTPAPARAKLVEACSRATSEPAFKEATKLYGTRVTFLDDKMYAAYLDKIDGEYKAIMTDLGLLKK